MTELVNPDMIERIVGHERHDHLHIARMVEAEQKLYVLHSRECKNSTPDLRQCPFSLALDKGLDPDIWDGITEHEINALAISVKTGQLYPRPDIPL